MLGIFLDTETNGINPFIHKAIEIAFQILDLKTGKEIFTYNSFISINKESWDKSNPKSLKINGISYQMMQSGKNQDEIRKEIIEIFKKFNIKRKKAIFICQNPSFDRIFFSKIIPPEVQENLNIPYHWLDFASMHFALNINNIDNYPGFSKDKIAKSQNLPKEEKPHRALNGVKHLIKCYEKVVGFPKKS